MSRWQRRARLVIAVVGIGAAVYVAFQFERRPPQDPASPVKRSDPKAIVETGRGSSSRTSRTFEQGRIEYESSRTYSDNSVKLLGVKIITERSGRTFTITGTEASIGSNESEAELVGHVQMTSSDGLTMRMERATHNDAEGTVRAPGPVQFERGRMTGTSIGIAYNRITDVLNLLENVKVDVAPGKTGDPMKITAASAEFNRPEHVIRFNGQMTANRQFERIGADAALARLAADDEALQRLELRGNSRIAGSRAGAGAMRALRGDEVDLDYAEDGQSITRAQLRGRALIAVAGERLVATAAAGRRGTAVRVPAADPPNREIVANRLDVSLAPDGATPTGIVGSGGVQLTIPADGEDPTRIISSDAMNATGNERQGLTNAHFAGKVQFRERGEIARVATSDVLDVTLSPGLGSLDDARFLRNVEFVEGDLKATASAARYMLDRGTLQLSGSETTPRIRTERIDVSAAALDMEFAGPKIAGKGNVRSVLLPAKKPAGGKPEAKAEPKMPSMLKQDREVNVSSQDLNYDGTASRATFSGEAQLFQAASETRIRGASITIDDKTGDLSATGDVVTNTILLHENKDGTKEREKSIGSSKDFRYEEALRRATYEGTARLVGLQGTLEARRIELSFKPSGDEVERAVGDDDVTFTEAKRKATGAHFQYFAIDDRYQLQGTPMVVVDECGKPTSGLALVYFRLTDKMTIDGGDVARTQTRGNRSQCP